MFNFIFDLLKPCYDKLQQNASFEYFANKSCYVTNAVMIIFVKNVDFFFFN